MVDARLWVEEEDLGPAGIFPFFLVLFYFLFLFIFISNYKFEFDSNFTLIFKCIIKVPT
jgi:hypothetical protein